MHCACVILSSVTCPTPLYFPRYLINRTIFEKKKVIEHKRFSFSLQILSETIIILRKIERDMIIFM